MRNISFLLFILFFTAVMLVSCDGEAPPVDLSDSSQTDEHTDYSGIFSSEYTICGDRFYFLTKKENERGTGSISLVSYANLKTGGSGTLCSDPLCLHRDTEECKYTGLTAAPVFESASVMYATRQNGAAISVCRYDIKNDKIEDIFTSKYGVEPVVIGVEGGFLYIMDKEIDDKGELIGTVVKIDTATYREVSRVYLPEKYSRVFLLHGGRFYIDAYNKLVTTDTDFGDERQLCELTNFFWTWYFDEKTDELYYLLNDNDKQTGAVYRCSDGVCEKVALPSDAVYSFQLTNSKLYYTVYDPVLLGVSSAYGNPKTYDYTGGKIYAVDRLSPGDEITEDKPRIVYESDGDYIMMILGSGLVFDGSLYYLDVEIIHETINGVEYRYISIAHDLAMKRVDLTTGEKEVIEFG